MTTRQLFIIDPRVSNYETLIASLPEGSEWVLLDSARDGVLQIKEILASYHDLDAIQILSHGGPGALYLGGSVLNSDTLQSYADALTAIGSSLKENGDLLLYGCNVGEGEIGQAFIAKLAQATGADVAASTDPTGNARLGGDWVLEATSGSVEAAALAAPGYAAVLDIINGTAGDDVLTGRTGSDTLRGLGGNDHLAGNQGNDVLDGGAGNDTLMGGTGQDEATYTGIQVGYTITRAPNGVLVSGPDGTDTVQDVETLRFADATVQLGYVGGGSPEFQVNTTTAKSQEQPAITALRDGGWVVTWISSGHRDGSMGWDAWDVYAQRYNAAGTAVGAEFQVNTSVLSINNYYGPAITELRNGGWVVTWTAGSDIYAQRYDAAGTASGAEFRVNTTTGNGHSNPSITALADGGWVMTWDATYQDQPGQGSSGTYAQRYSAAGGAVGAELRVNTTTYGSQYDPAITALSGGGWVVTWTSTYQDGSMYGIYAQRYNAAGVPSGPEFLVNTTTASNQEESAITALSDGGWVVAWASLGQDGSGWGIYAQRYDAAGVASGAEFRVNTTAGDSQSNPSITALSDGGWVVTWQSLYQDAPGYGIYGQRYDEAGAAVGTEFQVNTTTYDSQSEPSIAALSDGGWVVTWQSIYQDQPGQSGYGIYAQRYNADGEPFGGLTLNITGDASSQLLTGGTNGDTLSGLGGADTLDGGAGADTLIGGAGRDTFSFAASGNGVDTLIDFSYSDTIRIEGVSLSGSADVGTGSNLGQNAVQVNTGRSTTTVYVGTDAVAGADVTIILNGVFKADQFRLSGSEISVIAPDSQPPMAINFNPADASTGVPLDSNIVLTFSEAITRGTGNVVLKTSDGTTIATYDAATSSNLAVAGNVLTINPSADLSYGTGYKVEFSAGSIKDLAGNPFAGISTYDFTTIPAPIAGLSLVGTAYADTLTGGSGADLISGQGGNDLLIGKGGNDMIDGGTGLDTAIYSGSRNTHTVARSGALLTVSGGSDGVDTLVNVERLQFADVNLAFDIDGNAGQAYRIYQAAFNRTPDIGGLSFWIHSMDSGISLRDVAKGFIASAEFQSEYGANPTNYELTTLLYNNVLHRNPDQGGYDYWTGQLNNGLAREDALSFFADSAENQAALIGVIQDGITYIPL